MSKQKEDAPLQAVVLADSFNTRFVPLTRSRPRVLMPLCNIRLLDYTLEFLASNKVVEVAVLCCAFSEEIIEHLSKSPYAREMSVRTIVSKRCISVGEAMREIFSNDFVKGDFIMVAGDVVSNCDISPMLEEHKRRLKEDKEALMTVLLRECSPGHPLRSDEDDLLVVIDQETSKISSFQRPHPGRISVPSSAFSSSKSVLRYDLVNCHISICSPQVPCLFADNFDYETMDHLLKGVLEGDEITRKSVYASIIKSSYTARVSNYHTYDIISKDVLRRWAYPLVNDVFHGADQRSAKHKRHHIYLQSGVVLARSCVLKRDVLVGAGSKIGVEGGAETTLRGCTVGSNCVIGSGCQLENCYIWENVTIGNNCILDKVILGDNVILKDNVTVGPGSIIADNVVLGPDVTIPAGTKVACALSQQTGDDWGDENDGAEASLRSDISADLALGSESKGFVVRPEEPEDSDDEEELKLTNWIDPVPLHVAEQALSEPNSSDESDDEDAQAAMVEGVMDDEFDVFCDELIDLFKARVDVNDPAALPINNIGLETSSSRSAHNMTPVEVARAMVIAIVASADDRISDVGPAATYLITVFGKLASVIGNYAKEAHEQIQVINSLMTAIQQAERLVPALPKILLKLYEADVLDEDNIIRWYANFDEDHATPFEKVAMAKIKPFVVWLEEASEESESEESESD